MSIKHPSLVASQRWKLRAAFVSSLFASAFMWFDGPIAEFLGLSRYTPRLIGTFLGLAILVSASLAIRCPNCGLSLVWFALSKKVNGFVAELAARRRHVPEMRSPTKDPRCQ